MENLQAYGEFARVYDMFQDNVDYDVWGAWLKQQLKEDWCWILDAAPER